MKKYLLSFAVMMMGTALMTSCVDKEDSKTYMPVYVSNGAYVICSGNANSSIDGSVTYIDYATEKAAQNQFKEKNGRSLGRTANDAFVYGSKMYIAVTDANTIEVVNAKTLSSIRQIKLPMLMGEDKGACPRYISASEGMIYVTTYGTSTADAISGTSSGNGYVAAIDTLDFSLKQVYTAGSFPEDLTVANGKIYVANSNYGLCKEPSISVIDVQTGVDNPIRDVQIMRPTEIAVAGNEIYVLDKGNNDDVKSGLRHITGYGTSDLKVRTLFEATNACFYGSYIYSCNNTPGSSTKEFSAYNISTSSRYVYEPKLDNRFFYPNVISIDPVTENIFIGSYTEDVANPGNPSYNSDGYVVVYSSSGAKVGEFNCGVGPTAMTFNIAINYVEM